MKKSLYKNLVVFLSSSRSRKKTIVPAQIDLDKLRFLSFGGYTDDFFDPSRY